MMTPTSQERRKPGRPTFEESERLLTQIIDAGLAVFLKLGYEASSLEQIIQECGATRRSVTARFADKEAILFAVIEREMRNSIARFIPADAQVSARPLETLRDVCRLMFDGVLLPEWIAVYRLCIAEAAKFPEISARFIGLNDQLAADLESLVLRAQRQEGGPIGCPAVIATNLIGAFISNPMNRLTLGDRNFGVNSYKDAYFSDMWAHVAGLERATTVMDAHAHVAVVMDRAS